MDDARRQLILRIGGARDLVGQVAKRSEFSRTGFSVISSSIVRHPRCTSGRRYNGPRRWRGTPPCRSGPPVCPSAEGHASPDFGLLLAGGLVLVFREERIDAVPMLAVDHAGRDGVHVDAIRSGSTGRLRERDHGRLRGAVDRDQRLAPPPRLACHVDDAGPFRRSIMWRATACRVNSVPATLMSKDPLAKSSRVISVIGAAVKTAALLIRMSICRRR
jgi:hypothetical protein